MDFSDLLIQTLINGILIGGLYGVMTLGFFRHLGSDGCDKSSPRRIFNARRLYGLVCLTNNKDGNLF